MAGAPESYNTVTITVSPDTLNATSTAVQGLVQDIMNQMNNAMNTLSNLQLSWTGPSASAANTFTQDWNSAAQTLFGTQQDPNTGVLNRLVAGLAAAAVNYSEVEQLTQSNFNKLVSLLGGSASSASGTPTSVVNSSGSISTAITETF
jgi:uncharacterized protein YukE